MCIARRKFNEGITNSEEVVHRRVINNAEDIEFNVNYVYNLMEMEDLTFRVYLTVNAHDHISAFWDFQQEMKQMAKGLYNGDDGAETRISRLGSEWKSTLHKPRHRDEKKFQFDLDKVTKSECDEFVNRIEKVGAEVILIRETPNGYHVITNPFNYNKIDEWSSFYDELDTDGMVHVDRVKQ